ncbi:unnamed protein product [Acanthoscelides obtectus]|uniref:Uncharacterized protein n=1 Tax=Acanthoscelides obtectus TaxID=200917 RepID=A0A9P0LTT9_ACAOB|nr:unnamed protein product [Acanthoscelides obtectus]CAK1662634.1 DnaJ homolog subfamily B member 6-B [Acanthoscelides obtectus]
MMTDFVILEDSAYLTSEILKIFSGEFFGGSISEIFGLTSPSRRDSSRRGSNLSSSVFAQFNDIDSIFGAVERSFAGVPNQGTYVRQMSTDTQIINGKKTTTKRIIENGKEIIEKYENGVLTFKSVNGKPASITYR